MRCRRRVESRPRFVNQVCARGFMWELISGVLATMAAAPALGLAALSPSVLHCAAAAALWLLLRAGNWVRE